MARPIRRSLVVNRIVAREWLCHAADPLSRCKNRSRTKWDRVKSGAGNDLDRSAVADQAPQVLDIGVGQRDAAVGPVAFDALLRAVGLPVDEDIATRRATAGAGIGAVRGFGVRDVEREVV